MDEVKKIENKMQELRLILSTLEKSLPVLSYDGVIKQYESVITKQYEIISELLSMLDKIAGHNASR